MLLEDREVSGPGTPHRNSQLLLQRDEGLLLFEERDVGPVSQGEQGTTPPKGRPCSRVQVEEVLRGAQPAVLRADRRGTRMAGGVTKGCSVGKAFKEMKKENRYIFVTVITLGPVTLK